MGNMKNQKDKIVGSAKEKLGEVFNNEALEREGKTQVDIGEENEENYKKRVKELEDRNDEFDARHQDATKEQPGVPKNEKKTANPGPNRDKIEEERLKHYTGLEDKL